MKYIPADRLEPGMIVDKVVGTGDHLMIDLQELFTYDQDTFQHSINVSVLATTCGVGLGLGNDDLENLALAGVLHDLGKRAIPKEILNKEGALTDEERHAMMQHPQCGYDMLYDNTNISAFVRSAILSHHENWDGSGYSKHLAGNDIPQFGMIIHVANVYDALIRKRTYKDKFLQKEAVEYLMANCGTMFDIDIVNTFLNYLVVYPVGSTVTLSTGQTARCRRPCLPPLHGPEDLRRREAPPHQEGIDALLLLPVHFWIVMLLFQKLPDLGLFISLIGRLDGGRSSLLVHAFLQEILQKSGTAFGSPVKPDIGGSVSRIIKIMIALHIGDGILNLVL
ncbi:MAG: HD-GYP domain-containing protein [Lachnospiraceae bacterium]|nr:HD-GYP domain-containing protein [Lachnospiraceae bacterium]